MATTRAYRIHRFGGLDALRLDDIELSIQRDDELLISNRAVSVNPVDLKTIAGQYPAITADHLPYTLGRDFAGMVDRDALGDAPVRAGDAVYGFVGQQQGTFAGIVITRASTLARKPDTLDFAAAAAVPLAALTAWQGLFDHGALAAGERVLIHAAAGGVGHFAVQFARAKGAEVFATASGDGIDFVRALGVDRVIDYRSQRFEDVARDIDLVFDPVGGQTQARSWEALKDGGRLISTLGEPSAEQATRRHARAARYTAQPDARQLGEIGTLIDSGQVRVHVAETFSFDQIPVALQRLREGHARGKLVAAW